MSLIDNIESKSEEEVIQILQKNGIQVINKPIALMPDNMEAYCFGNQSIGFIQMDIYDALRKLAIRAKLSKDPFK